MNEEKIEEILKRHVGALSEEFQGRLSGVAEGVVMLGEKMDRLETKVDRLETKMDRLETKVDHIENVQNSHTEMIGILMEDVSEIKDTLKNKVDQTEFNDLKQTVLSMS